MALSCTIASSMSFVKCLMIAALCNVCIKAARILAVFPTPSISHQITYRSLTQELVRRGHEVVVITTDPAFPKGPTPVNLTEINVHDISYKLWREEVLFGTMTSGKSNDVTTQVRILLPLFSKIFEFQMRTKEVENFIKNKTNHFDMLLTEASVRPAVSLSHVFKVPVILMSSLVGVITSYDIMGAPRRPPLFYPSNFRQRFYNLTLWEKFVEMYHYCVYENIYAANVEMDNKVVKRLFGPDMPTIYELENNAHMSFVNVHPIWEVNRPVPPSVNFMGGLHLHEKPTKELPEDLKSYLESSKNGVIYVSYGTNVSPSVLPPQKIQMLVRVFSQLPYDVLWKWDDDELAGRTPNIRISKWLPQFDLLRHPKIKLFITQGGLQSTDEALAAGVPLIGMPMFADQWYNVEQYVHHKIGLRLDIETLTEETLLNAINTILTDDSYRTNVRKLYDIMMRDQRQTPMERAIWWVEHVLRHGGATHLRASAANMPWSEYLDLQLVGTLAAIVTALIVTVSFVLRYLYNFMRSLLTMAIVKPR